MNVEDEVAKKLERYNVENEQDWRGEIVRIPWLHFRSNWQVRIIPPFGDAVIRFQVILPSGTLKSVFMDSRNSLGVWWGADQSTPEPYWEVYPYQGDVGRCALDDTIMLMEMIQDETWGQDEDTTDKGTGGDSAEAGSGKD